MRTGRVVRYGPSCPRAELSTDRVVQLPLNVYMTIPYVDMTYEAYVRIIGNSALRIIQF